MQNDTKKRGHFMSSHFKIYIDPLAFKVVSHTYSCISRKSQNFIFLLGICLSWTLSDVMVVTWLWCNYEASGWETKHIMMSLNSTYEHEEMLNPKSLESVRECEFNLIFRAWGKYRPNISGNMWTGLVSDRNQHVSLWRGKMNLQ